MTFYFHETNFLFIRTDAAALSFKALSTLDVLNATFVFRKVGQDVPI